MLTLEYRMNRDKNISQKDFLLRFCIIIFILLINVSAKKFHISSVHNSVQTTNHDHDNESTLNPKKYDQGQSPNLLSQQKENTFLKSSIAENSKQPTQKKTHVQRLLTTCTIPDCISCITQGTQFCTECQAPKIPVPTLLNACVIPSYTSQATITTTCTVPNCVSCAKFALGPIPMEYCVQCQPDFRLMFLEGVCVSSALFIQSDNGFRSYNEYYYDCVEGCLRCEPSLVSDICNLCKKGYSLDVSAFNCVKCSGNCETCNYQTPGTCLTCPIGFVLENGQCLKCTNELCASCKDSDQSVCTSCKNSLMLINETCVPCGPNCKTCSTKCEACNSGFLLVTSPNASTTCVKCIFGCYECSSMTTCSKCYPGFYQNSQKTCIRCQANCGQCSSDTMCTQCLSGFDLLNSSCYLPIPNCVIRNLNGTCRVCKSHFELTQNQTCEFRPTQLAPTNLATQVCMIGLFNNHYWCHTCDNRFTRCIECTSSKCFKCQEGYYVANQTNTCTQCLMDGCKSCQTQGKCLQCSDGYFLVHESFSNDNDMLSLGYCRKCDQNCKTCHLKSRICLSCNENFTLNDENNCEGGFKFEFKIALAFDFEEDSSHLQSLRDFLAEKMSSNMPEAEQTGPSEKGMIKFTKIYKGSTVVQGYIDQPSQEALRSVSSSVSQSLATTRSIGSIDVVSVQVDGERVEPVFQDYYRPEQKKSDTLAIVLGVVLGALAIVIIGVVGVVVWRKNKVQINSSQQNHDSKKQGDEINIELSIQEQKSQQQLNANDNKSREIPTSEAKSEKSLQQSVGK